MKKIKLTLAVLGALLLPVIALAQIEPIAPGGTGARIGSLQQIIHDIENAGGLVFGAIAVIMFLIAGILFLTSSGDADKIKTARMAFMWGVAGVVVGLMAFSIIAIVGSLIK